MKEYDVLRVTPPYVVIDVGSTNGSASNGAFSTYIARPDCNGTAPAGYRWRGTILVPGSHPDAARRIPVRRG